MDEELIYPNPVARSDLPVIKPKWPKVVIGIIVALLLGTLFFPQIISSPIGRVFVKIYLGKKFNGEISLTRFKTSWFGGSSAEEIWVKNADGHVIGAHLIRCDASLGKLLRGNYALGKCVIEQPYVDWVVDYGDMNHTDTFDRLTNSVPALPGAVVVPPTAPRISGEITITGGVLNIIRGRVTPRVLQMTYRQMRFTGLNGTLSAKSFTDAWQCDATAMVGDDKQQSGTVQLKGTIGCSGAGVFSTSALQMSMDIVCQNGPANPLVPVCMPLLTAEDAKTVFGTTLTSFHVTMSASAGKLTFSTFEVIGEAGQLTMRPTVDLVANPCVLTLSEPATFNGAIPGGELRQALYMLVPFLSGASDLGRACLNVGSVSLPLAENGWRNLSATGELQIDNAKLAMTPSPSDDLPKGIVNQLEVLSGEQNSSPLLNIAKLPFKIETGRVVVAPTMMMLGNRMVSLAGESRADKTLRMSVTVNQALPSGASTSPADYAVQSVTVPLLGTCDTPRLDFDAATAALAPTIKPTFQKYLAHQVAVFRTRQLEDEKGPQRRAVESMMKKFEPSDPTAETP